MLDETGLIAFTQELIRRKSVSGGEEAVTRLVSERLRALGFDEVWVEDFGTVVGSVHGAGHPRGRQILFDAHIDTVDVSSPEQWTRSPFGGGIGEPADLRAWE